MEQSEAILELLRQQGKTLEKLGASQDTQTKELHAIRLDQAVATTRLETLASIPARVSQLELRANENTAKIAQHQELHDAHVTSLVRLQSIADRTSGWQGPVGKIVTGIVTALGVLLLGAVLALLGIRASRAATPDLRFDAAANAKCFAAPAKQPPKYLYL